MKNSPSTACHGGKWQSSSKSSPFFIDPRPVEAGQAEASDRYCEIRPSAVLVEVLIEPATPFYFS